MAVYSLTRDVDNAFLTTWFNIKNYATDNILDATVLTAALKMAGRMTPQVGGEFITENIRYARSAAVGNISQGGTLPSGDTELETMAAWTWRHTAGAVQRNLFDDQKNQGPDRIKSLVETKLSALRDTMEEKINDDLHVATNTAETGEGTQTINDILPTDALKKTGTYGKIARPTAYADSGNGVFIPSAGNTFWGPKLKALVTPIEVNLLDDMKTLWNSCHANQSAPNFIITTQDLFEIYETFAVDAAQIVKSEGGLADLGFEVLKFKGQAFTFDDNMAASTLYMLNLNFIKMVYDPTYWFDMTEWKTQPLSTVRIAHVICATNLISNQLRRHGALLASVTT